MTDTTRSRRPGEAFDRLTAEEVAALMAEDGGVVLVDVREPNEVAATGTLPGARLLPLGHVGEALGGGANADLLPLDGSQPLVFYCAAGARSARAAAMAAASGARQAGTMEGGIAAWTAGGHPVERQDG